MPIANIRDQLIRDEGWRLTAYQDTRGFWTIGCGHYLGHSIPEVFAGGIDDGQCNALFEADLTHVNSLLTIYLPWWTTIDTVRGAVLQNAAFNLGVAALATFHTFLGLMRAQSWIAAADDLRHTAVYRELPHRYERLATQITSGVFQ